MELKQILIPVISIIALTVVAQAEKLENEYPAAVPASLHLPVKSRSDFKQPQANSDHQRDKKWSLYLIPDPPYGRGPYPVPGAAYPQFPYTHPKWVLERNSYPSDDFQFFYY